MEDEKILPETEDSAQVPGEVKPLWQMQKERWYDKLPLNLKQLDTIVIVCWILIFVVIGVITLDALDIFNPFGY